MKKILLRNSWQTKNIGDISHTPGFLNLAKQFMPDYEIWLWPCQLDRGVREMILDNYPGLRIVESKEDIAEAFRECDFFINGSGPGMERWSIGEWKNRTHKPYGLFGITVDCYWTEEIKKILSESSFIFCRESISSNFLKKQKLECPMIDFAPDTAFGLNLKHDPAADSFMKENGLETEKFVCVIPRMRCTPASFDDEHFYYDDPQREKPSLDHIESDMAKMREVICHIVEKYDLKVLICPEMTYQVPLGRRYLYERLPDSVRKKVVLKQEYWITSEAVSVYSQAKMLVSMDMHSPIMFINLHKPVILLRQEEDTWKGQMLRDIGLQDWILELNVSDSNLIKSRVDQILQDYPAARKQAADASCRALEFERNAMENIKPIIQ